jgi:hypothetical protein
MRRAVLLAALTCSACSGPTTVAEKYEGGTPKFYTVVDPKDPHVVLDDGTRMGVDGAQAGDQVDLGSLMYSLKKTVDD